MKRRSPWCSQLPRRAVRWGRRSRNAAQAPAPCLQEAASFSVAIGRRFPLPEVQGSWGGLCPCAALPWFHAGLRGDHTPQQPTPSARRGPRPRAQRIQRDSREPSSCGSCPHHHPGAGQVPPPDATRYDWALLVSASHVTPSTIGAGVGASVSASPPDDKLRGAGVLAKPTHGPSPRQTPPERQEGPPHGVMDGFMGAFHPTRTLGGQGDRKIRRPKVQVKMQVATAGTVGAQQRAAWTEGGRPPPERLCI